MRLEVVATLPQGGQIREQLHVEDTSTVRFLHHTVETMASQRLGRRVRAVLSIDGTRPEQEALVSTLGGNTVNCQLVEVYIPPKLLRVSPLWGPEGGSTRVHLHGDNLSLPPSTRIRFGSTSVPCEFIEGEMFCRTPLHPPGIVNVSLMRCEEDETMDEATFEFVRLEAAFDVTFARTNAFCPLRSQQQHDDELDAEDDASR